MGNITIVKEKICGEYRFSNDIANISGNYEKDGLNDNNILTISGACYSSEDETLYYGSFNSVYEEDKGKLRYVIFETKPEYKEIIQGLTVEIKEILK